MKKKYTNDEYAKKFAIVFVTIYFQKLILYLPEEKSKNEAFSYAYASVYVYEYAKLYLFVYSDEFLDEWIYNNSYNKDEYITIYATAYTNGTFVKAYNEYEKEIIKKTPTIAKTIADEKLILYSTSYAIAIHTNVDFFAIINYSNEYSKAIVDGKTILYANEYALIYSYAYASGIISSYEAELYATKFSEKYTLLILEGKSEIESTIAGLEYAVYSVIYEYEHSDELANKTIGLATLATLETYNKSYNAIKNKKTDNDVLSENVFTLSYYSTKYDKSYYYPSYTFYLIPHIALRIAKLKYSKYSTVYSISITDGKTPEYANAYSDEIAEGKSTEYATIYATEIVDGRSIAYAKTYTGLYIVAINEFKSPVYAKAYADEIINGKTHEYAKVYACSYDVLYDFSIKYGKTSEWAKAYSKLMLEK